MKTNLFEISVIALMVAGGFSSCTKEGEGLECDCKDELYYYNYEEKIFLVDRSNFLNDWLFVGFETQVQNDEIVRYIHQTGLFKSVDVKKIYRPNPNSPVFKDMYNYVFVKTKKPKTCSQFKEIIRILEKEPMVTLVNFVFCQWDSPNCKDIMSFSEYFNVKVKDKDDLSDLYTIVQETNTLILSKNEFRPEWISIRANKHSKGDALQMANFFHETGKFVAISYGFWATGSALD